MSERQIEIRKKRKKLKSLAYRREYDNKWCVVDEFRSVLLKENSNVFLLINLLNQLEIMKEDFRENRPLRAERKIDNMIDQIKFNLGVKE